jgi:glycine rich protein
VNRRMRCAALACVTLAGVVSLLLAGAAGAIPSLGCTLDSTTGETTCLFASTGAEQTFTVPVGVAGVHVVARGAAGGSGDYGVGAGGRGAMVSGDLSLSPGELLYVEVGGAPTGAGWCFSQAACVGGFNGGGSSSYGGGGGGASDVRTATRIDSGSLASRLLVAAGGGGGGWSCFAVGGQPGKVASTAASRAAPAVGRAQRPGGPEVPRTADRAVSASAVKEGTASAAAAAAACTAVAAAARRALLKAVTKVVGVVAAAARTSSRRADRPG